MKYQEITLSEFYLDTKENARYTIDIDGLVKAYDASPIHVFFIADKIMVEETFPAVILLLNKSNYVNISQITKIERAVKKDGNIRYQITCGLLPDLTTTVVIDRLK